MASAERIGVVGQTQSGKTRSMKRLAAAIAGPAFDRMPVLVVDPVTDSPDNWKPHGYREALDRAQLIALLRRWHAGERWPIVYRGSDPDWGPIDKIRGGLLLVVDEAAEYTRPTWIDPTFQRVLKRGRHWGIHTIVGTWSPTEVHPDVLGSSPTLVVHRITYASQLAALRRITGGAPLRWEDVPNTHAACWPMLFQSGVLVRESKPW